MRRSFIVLFALTALMLGGCKPEKPESRFKDAPKASSAPETANKHTMDIGDVEAMVSLELTVADESKAQNVRLNEQNTRREQLSMVIATIEQPYPKELQVVVRIKERGLDESTRRPVVLLGSIYRDDKPIYSFNTIIAERPKRNPDGTLINPVAGMWANEFKTDVLVDAEPLPKTMLIHAETQVFLMPENTNPTTINPATATSPDTTLLTSNPMRINFAEEGVGK